MENLLRNEKTGLWKRAVFTVEAAFLIPLIATIIVLLLGYIYYTHEKVWSTSVAYEAGFYSVQRREKDVTAQALAEERIENRTEEKPLPFGTEEFSVKDDDAQVTVSWSGNIIRDVFDSRFDFTGKSAVRKFKPGKAMRTLWIGKYVIEKLGST